MNFEEERSFDCPYCNEPNEILVDLTGGEKQKFVHDCAVCCHPILIKLEVNPEGISSFSAEQE